MGKKTKEPPEARLSSPTRRDPTVLMFPGLSIMEQRWLSPGLLLVRCPGCGASLVYSTADPATMFVHEDEDCPILRRIEAAIAMFEAMVGGWE